jgi:hypothetical protein
MRGINIPLGKLIGVLGGCDSETVCKSLQLTVAALFAKHAEMIAFHKQHIDDVGSQLIDLRSLALDHDSVGDRLRTSGLRPAVYEHGAHSAAAVWCKVLVCAEARDVLTRFIDSLHDGLPLLPLDHFAVQ